MMFSSFWIWAASRLSPLESRRHEVFKTNDWDQPEIQYSTGASNQAGCESTGDSAWWEDGWKDAMKVLNDSWVQEAVRMFYWLDSVWPRIWWIAASSKKGRQSFIAGAFRWFRNLSHTEACHTSRSCCDNRVSWLAADLQHISLWIKIPTTCFMLHTATCTTTVLTSRPKGIQLCNDRMKNGTIYIQSWYYIDVILHIIEKYRCIWHACR